MRIVVSIQSNRGSSRGLVHYLAHSKVDSEREPANGRELFNNFGDSLDVKSSNNYLKTDISAKRPSNDELHHLVLSFRSDDFARLGKTEREQKRAAKEITRASLKQLETDLNADKLAWVAAVHLNTGNPHVHIALQKQYFSNELERKYLAKIPRAAIPHYEKSDGREKKFVRGSLIDAAAEKMEELILKNYARDERRSAEPDRLAAAPARPDEIREHTR